jgi:hypothetical protein
MIWMTAKRPIPIGGLQLHTLTLDGKPSTALLIRLIHRHRHLQRKLSVIYWKASGEYY